MDYPRIRNPRYLQISVEIHQIYLTEARDCIQLATDCKQKRDWDANGPGFGRHQIGGRVVAGGPLRRISAKLANLRVRDTRRIRLLEVLRPEWATLRNGLMKPTTFEAVGAMTS